jgi:DNA-binding transcriptional regulator YiaG
LSRRRQTSKIVLGYAQRWILPFSWVPVKCIRKTHKKNATLRKVTVDLVVIGRRIRYIRGVDLKQEEFARALGVGQTQLSRYELGQSAPTLNILLRLKIYSRKSIDWILLGEKPVG